MPRNSNTPRLLVRSSSIHAAGCYTLAPTRSGSRVIEYHGPRIGKDLANERYADRPVTYLFSVGKKGEVIDGFGTAMFINHSCDPNCESDEDRGGVFVRAIRNIAAGEELLYEYNLFDSDEDDADCYCGAPNCRGTMFSEEEVKRQKRRKARKAALRKAARAAK